MPVHPSASTSIIKVSGFSNAMEPVIVLNIMQSMRMLLRGMAVLREKCIIGIEADRERCQELLEGSLVTVTALNQMDVAALKGPQGPVGDPAQLDPLGLRNPAGKAGGVANQQPAMVFEVVAGRCLPQPAAQGWSR